MTTLLTIPPELRNQILTYALWPGQHIRRPSITLPTSRRTVSTQSLQLCYCPLAALLLTSKQLHFETSSLLLSLPPLQSGEVEMFDVTMNAEVAEIAYEMWWEGLPKMVCRVHGLPFVPRLCLHFWSSRIDNIGDRELIRSLKIVGAGFDIVIKRKKALDR